MSDPVPLKGKSMSESNHLAQALKRLYFGARSASSLLSTLGAPDESGWSPTGAPDDEEGWIQARQRALDVNTALADLVAGLSQAEIDSTLEVWGSPKHRAIQGIIAHNSYHTAEIITVRHMQGFWMEST